MACTASLISHRSHALRLLPTTSAAWPRTPNHLRERPRARPLNAAARAQTVPVWETLVLVHNATDKSQGTEEQQEVGGACGDNKYWIRYLIPMPLSPPCAPRPQRSTLPSCALATFHHPHSHQLLDTLWSLQYRTPGACCASAGPVVQSASRDRSASAPRAAVYYRFSSQAQAERFVAGPAFSDAKSRLLGSGTVTLALWKVLVPNDMEALFKRGPAFEAGVDLLLFLEPAAAAEQTAAKEAERTVGAAEAATSEAAGAGPAVATGQAVGPAALQPEMLVELVGRLQEQALAAGSVQVSCGEDVTSLEPRFVWMARFPHEESAQQFLRSPLVEQLATAEGRRYTAPGPAAGADGQQQLEVQRKQGPALFLSTFVVIEVGDVQQSKQRL
ncbi:hypothetical protein Agub_g5686 [Astrephomene gubernaculifera]|uniref:Uncharacterized protein n=1 Tax=Astrephomene gubernaculifera TaxID=47775 RepID=A0AAD3DNP5_9CHLO|nr:hypothetical protein Agub_g5686 [Astrephomene gubernaculifera]